MIDSAAQTITKGKPVKIMSDENSAANGGGDKSRIDRHQAESCVPDADGARVAESELFESGFQNGVVADMLIQELEDVDCCGDAEESDSDAEKFHCPRCDRETADGSALCAECEAIVKKYPFSPNAIFLFIVALFISFIGLVAAAANYPIAANTAKGTLALKGGDLNKCYGFYDEAYSYAAALNKRYSDVLPMGFSLFSSGNKTLVYQFVALNKLNGPYSAGQYIEKYFGDKIPPKLVGIKREFDEISEAYSILSRGFDDYYTAIGDAEATYGGLMAVVDKIVASHDLPAYLITYYRFLAAVETDAGTDVAVELMDSVISEKPGAHWLYASDAIFLYKQSGDFVKALGICNEILKTDPTNTSAIAYSMSVLRMDGNFKGALSVYDKAMDITETTPEIERQRAIVLMLKGEYAEAETILIDNYDESTLTIQYAETLCACAVMTGNGKKYDEVRELLESYEISLSESILGLQSGTVTVEEIYLEGGGDSV